MTTLAPRKGSLVHVITSDSRGWVQGTFTGVELEDWAIDTGAGIAYVASADVTSARVIHSSIATLA